MRREILILSIVRQGGLERPSFKRRSNYLYLCSRRFEILEQYVKLPLVVLAWIKCRKDSSLSADSFSVSAKPMGGSVYRYNSAIV